MKHNQLFSIIKNKKDWTHCKSGRLSAEWATYEEDDIVYILFQETDSISDWIQNLSFTKRKYGNLKFHHGFYELYDLMRDDVIKFVESLPKNKTLVVSGWSQGAAIAQIAVQDIYYHTGRKSILISFGTPMAIYGRKTRDACREAVIEAYEYCNKSDIVTYQPPFPKWYHIRRVNVGKFRITKLFKPKVYHTNYEETVPPVLVLKTIKTKEDSRMIYVDHTVMYCAGDITKVENYEKANKGKHHSEETKRIHSALLKGKHWKVVDGKRVWY